MGEKRTATIPVSMPLAANAPPGVLGVLDDLSSMILGQLATRRKLQAILEALSEHLDVDCARFVLDVRLGRDGAAAAPAAGGGDEQLAASLRDYPGILASLSRGTGTVVENGGAHHRGAADGTAGTSLCVPVCRGGDIVGLLCVSTNSVQGSFRPWEVDFCSILANMAGAALTNAA